MDEAIDYSTVKWVKRELDATLKQARQALEAHVDTPTDDVQLRFCAVHLHQVCGTLQMVELYGAALLAEEMEFVTEALIADAVGQRQEAYELVMRGILQLPDYLERLIAGHPDMPLVLLPLLNDLRAIRGQKLLSENSLFMPDLDAALPAELQATLSGEDSRVVARMQRHSYQLALLGWFRGKQAEANLERLRRVLTELRLASATDSVRRLWWAAEGMVAALRHGWLEPSMATKLLLGQTDRQIKRLIDEGEAALAADAPRDLIKNLLFYIARARDGGEPVTQIKSVFRLGALLPDQSDLEQAAVSLSGHNTELMATVSAAIKEDLARVKDAVDLFQRGGGKTLTTLQPAAEILRQVADTLGMLGLGSLRQIAQTQAEATTDIVEGRRQVNEPALMDVAAALISIESSLDALAKGRAAPPPMTGENDGQALPDAEFDQVRMVVADEAIRDIAQAKDSILAFMESGSDFSLLDKVPQIFHQISGGLLLLGEPRAASIVDALCNYVADGVCGASMRPDQPTFDALADAVSSVEYYLEGLREGRLFGQSILDAAEHGIARLGSDTASTDAVPVVEEAPDVADQWESGAQEIETPALEDPDSAEAAGYHVDEILAGPAAAADFEQADAVPTDEPAVADMEAIELADVIAATESPLPVDLVSTAEASGIDVSFEQTEIVVTDAPASPVAPAAAPHALSEDIDAEILEIFIEESTEELANIKDSLPRWLADEEDRDALADMRRSFHTLKGSGRLVGAMRIGEFAWAFENVLNRVIDGTVARSATVCALLERAVRVLPELIAQIRDGSATVEPAEALAGLAQACSRGEAVSLDALDAQPTGAAIESDPDISGLRDGKGIVAGEVAAEMASDQTSVHDPRLDPVLYEIFSNESRDHVGTVQSFLEVCRTASHDCHVTDPLLRALHTLHGSARMAGADVIADVASAIERYTKALRRDDLPLSGEGAKMIARAMGVIESLVARLQHEDISHPDYAAVVHGLDDLAQRTAHAGSEATTPPDAFPADALPAPAADSIIEDVVVIEAACPGSQETPQEIPQETQSPEVGVPDASVRDETESMVPDEVVLEGVGDVDPFGPSLDVIGHDFADTLADPFDEPLPMVEAAAPGTGEAEPWAPSEPLAVLPSPTDSFDESGDAAIAAAEPDVGGAESGDDAVTHGHGQDIGYDTADQDLIDVFLEEGEEILAASDAALHKWVAVPDDQALMAELQRYLHTLKGGARMAGIAAIGDLSHSLESSLIAVVDGLVAPSTDLFEVLLVAQDRLVQMLEAVRDRKPLQAATGVIDRLEALRRGEAPIAIQTRIDGEPIAELIPAPEPVEMSAPDAVAAQRGPVMSESSSDEQMTMARSQQELVRVRADLLDNMVNFAGEISIYRSRIEQQIGSMRFNLSELGQTVERIREQLRKLEIETEAQVLFRYERDATAADEQFDPLEMDRYSHLQQLSRSMLESISDLVSIQGLMDNITRESETLLLQQSRVNTELQEGLMRTRMVPFAGLAPRMRRIVRQAAQELGRRAELVLEGAEGEMDRTVIDRIIAPIEHMLRNAVAHGIETPERRTAAGKKPSGTIRISLSRDGSEVVIRLADDGAGMNIGAIRRKARERGLITDDVEVSDSDVMQFVLETGFSTAEQVSQIAGRGVGMDVVNSEVKQLGGSLHIDSQQGAGTTFTIRLPFTLAISQALLVQVHEEVYAIPLTGIEGIVRMRGDELSRYLGDSSAHFEYAGFSYPVHNLGELLGHGAAADFATAKRLPVLLVRSGDHRMALQVEGLLGSRETVVKSVGPQISSVRGISGATILGDGRVVLILDLGGLLRSGGVSATIERVLAGAVRPQTRQALVMVVDDSITVRKVTTRLLERNGMQVITAKDGVDAVAMLQEHMPDVMLLDIEMPRMDGFELATHIRNEARLRAIPIIMITSRTGDKHRRRAMEIGVDRYLGKPFQESELLATITALVKERGANG